MKKLVFAALLCGGIAQMGTGCIIVEDDDPEPIDDRGYITATWDLVSGDADVAAACPEGATTIEIITQDVNGEQSVDKFDCVDGVGTVERYPGTYTIWARLTNDTSSVDYAVSLSTDLIVDAGLETPQGFTMSIDRGSFYFQWTLTDAGDPTDCANEDVGNVAITSTLVGDADTWYDDEAPCADGGLTTPGIPLGDYTVSVSLLDLSNSGAIYVADAIDASIQYGNHFNDLGTFELDAAGN